MKKMENRDKCLYFIENYVTSINEFLDIAKYSISKKLYFRALLYIDSAWKFYGRIMEVRIGFNQFTEETQQIIDEMYERITKVRNQLVKEIGI